MRLFSVCPSLPFINMNVQRELVLLLHVAFSIILAKKKAFILC